MIRTRIVAVAVCVLLIGCSGDDASSNPTADTTPEPTSPAIVGSTELPIVEQIDDAIAALETELGGPQEYFEINATARLINLFVAVAVDDAVDAAKSVQPWLYFDGQLTSDDAQPAEGGVLRASDIAFDPATIFALLRAELPSATIESFYIHGDGHGAVQYAALLTTSQGGALEVQLGSDGQILSSQPLN